MAKHARTLLGNDGQRLLILTLVARLQPDDDSYAYRIAKATNEIVGCSLNANAVGVILAGCGADGLVTWKHMEQPNGRPTKVYAITPDGERVRRDAIDALGTLYEDLYAQCSEIIKSGVKATPKAKTHPAGTEHATVDDLAADLVDGPFGPTTRGAENGA